MNYKLCLSVVVVILTITLLGYCNYVPLPAGLSREFAEQRVREVLMDTTYKCGPYLRRKNNLIDSEDLAIQVAEPILFRIYGREHILDERPYDVYKIDEYWFLSGTLPRHATMGGSFELILDARDARVLSITHYK